MDYILYLSESNNRIYKLTSRKKSLIRNLQEALAPLTFRSLTHHQFTKIMQKVQALPTRRQTSSSIMSIYNTLSVKTALTTSGKCIIYEDFAMDKIKIKVYDTNIVINDFKFRIAFESTPRIIGYNSHNSNILDWIIPLSSMYWFHYGTFKKSAMLPNVYRNSTYGRVCLGSVNNSLTMEISKILTFPFNFNADLTVAQEDYNLSQLNPTRTGHTTSEFEKYKTSNGYEFPFNDWIRCISKGDVPENNISTNEILEPED